MDSAFMLDITKKEQKGNTEDTSTPQDAARNAQRWRSSDIAFQLQQVRMLKASLNTGNQEAIDVVTCTDNIRQNQASGRREKPEDSTGGENKDEILESMRRQIMDLESKCEAKDRKMAEMKAKIDQFVLDYNISPQYLLECAQARLALVTGLISSPLRCAKQGSLAFRSYLEQWTNTEDRLTAVRDLLAKCDDDESRIMPESMLRHLTINLHT